MSLEWDCKSDRLLLIGTADGGIKAWNVDAKRVVCDLNTTTEFPSVLDLKCSPVEPIFVSAEPIFKVLLILLKAVLPLGKDPPAITSICLNHNGKILAAAATDGMIHMFDMSAGLQITGWPAHDSAISSVLFGPDETSIFSLGIDGKVFEWSLQNQGKILWSRNCHRTSFRCKENLSGKVVLITGASSGLGELIAYEYAKLGAYLAIIATQKSESRLEQVANRARVLGSPDVLFVFADVSKIDQCRMFVDDTVKYFGRLDHLVCNAGIGGLYSINNDVTKFARVIDTNFWGSVYPTQFAIPHLMKTNGRIIVNASAAGVLNPPGGGFYNASKAALISFYETLKFEVSPKISITILTLGFIQTNLITAEYYSNTVGAHYRKDLRDEIATMEAEPCVKAIVEGIRKGETYITEPRFYKTLLLVKFLFPQLHHFIFKSYSPIIED